MVSNENEELIKIYLDSAKAKFESDDFDGTIKDADRIRSIDPKNVEALYLLGLSYTQITDLYNSLEIAIEYFDQVIEIDKNHSEAWSNRGTAKSKLGHHEDAAKDHNEAIRLDRQNDGA